VSQPLWFSEAVLWCDYTSSVGYSERMIPQLQRSGRVGCGRACWHRPAQRHPAKPAVKLSLSCTAGALPSAPPVDAAIAAHRPLKPSHDRACSAWTNRSTLALVLLASSQADARDTASAALLLRR
jgi:hypothetical protein